MKRTVSASTYRTLNPEWVKWQKTLGICVFVSLTMAIELEHLVLLLIEHRSGWERIEKKSNLFNCNRLKSWSWSHILTLIRLLVIYGDVQLTEQLNTHTHGVGTQCICHTLRLSPVDRSNNVIWDWNSLIDRCVVIAWHNRKTTQNETYEWIIDGDRNELMNSEIYSISPFSQRVSVCLSLWFASRNTQLAYIWICN